MATKIQYESACYRCLRTFAAEGDSNLCPECEQESGFRFSPMEDLPGDVLDVIREGAWSRREIVEALPQYTRQDVYATLDALVHTGTLIHEYRDLYDYFRIAE